MKSTNLEHDAQRTNQDWVEQLSAGQESSIQALRDFIHRGLMRALHGKMHESMSEDFTQESVLKILNGIGRYRGDSLFTTWAMSIAMRVAFTELRRARWKDVSLHHLTEQQNLPEPAAREDSPVSAWERSQLCEKLRELIDTQLTDRQRVVIRAELEGMPQAVLCDRLSTNRNALYKLGHDARLKLKNGLLASGISEEEVRSILATASNN